MNNEENKDFYGFGLTTLTNCFISIQQHTEEIATNYVMWTR
jgi:hypothetical protein